MQEGTIAVANAMDGLVIWHQPALPCTPKGIYAAVEFLHSISIYQLLKFSGNLELPVQTTGGEGSFHLHSF